MTEHNENGGIAALLRAQVILLGKIAVPEDQLIDTICKGRGDEKQLKAYNLCDGTRTQSEVLKIAKLDSGNFSRTLNRWVNSGIMFKIPDRTGEKLQHLFPVAIDRTGKSRKEN